MARKPGSKSQQSSISTDQPVSQQLALVSIPDLEQLLARVVRSVLLETSEKRTSADDLLKKNEAAKLFRCHPSTIERWAKSGEIPCITRGRLKFYSRADLLAYMDRSESNPNNDQSSN